MLKFPAGCPHFKDEDWGGYQLIPYLAMVKFAPSKGLAIDCGAHAGIMTRRMARDFERVVAFEPVHHQLLKSNTEDLPNIQIEPYGVLDFTGTVPISINTENSGDNRVGRGPDTIETRELDSYRFESVSVIKMDIQGSEFAALVGARNTIQRSHPTLMIETENWDDNRTLIDELLTDWGYRVVDSKNADRIWRWTGWP